MGRGHSKYWTTRKYQTTGEDCYLLLNIICNISIDLTLFDLKVNNKMQYTFTVLLHCLFLICPILKSDHILLLVCDQRHFPVPIESDKLENQQPQIYKFKNGTSTRPLVGKGLYM